MGKNIFHAVAMSTNGTAVEGVCVTRCNPSVDCPGCEHGRIPVGRRVWRGICKVGCGCAEPVEACDRVTMTLVYR